MTALSPTISIIVPVFNVECYLEQCLESITGQTYKNLEIIIIDDASTDRSLRLVEEISKGDSRFTILRQSSNSGYGAAVNRGIDFAHGEYISIIEPDDFISTDMMEILLDNIIQHDAQIAKCSFEQIDTQRGNKHSRQEWFVPGKAPAQIFNITDYPEFLFYHPSIWSCLYKTSFLRGHHIRFKEYPGAAWVDNLFQVQVLTQAEKIIFVDVPLYYYRIGHNESSSCLKNINIPFDRCKEINEYMKNRDLDHSVLMAFLYKREISYMKLVLYSPCDYVENVSSMYNVLIRTARSFHEDVLKQFKIFSSSEQKLVQIFCQGDKRKMRRIHKKYQSRNKRLFRIKISKRKILVKIFGLSIYES